MGLLDREARLGIYKVCLGWVGLGEALGLSLYWRAVLRLLLLVVVGVVRLLLGVLLLLRLRCILGPLLGIGLPILRRKPQCLRTAV